jgi:hypothetical protein
MEICRAKENDFDFDKGDSSYEFKDIRLELVHHLI